MKNKGVSTLKVAGAYIGTVVGAGFATGQEVLQFFARFGANGLLGIIFNALLFILFGYIIMALGKELNAQSHLEIIKHTGGRIIGGLIDGVIAFFLFGAFTAMLAGTGALFEEQFGLHGLLGNLLMAILTAITVLTGISGVINSISIIVPFLLAAVLGISIYSVINMPPDMSIATLPLGESGLITNWFIAAVLYISYNTILTIAVLGPLGVQARDKKAIKYGAILGGIGLGAGSLMIYFALLGNINEVAELQVPMIYIAGRIAPLIQILYAIVLIAAIYTTSVGSLFGFVARFVKPEASRLKGTIIITVITVLAFLASQFGFTNLVKYLYPLVGYAGIILLICLIYSRFKFHTGREQKDKG